MTAELPVNATLPARHKCCACCAVEGDPDVCGFNGRRHDHGGPCEDCEPEAFRAWLEAQPEWRTSDVPF